VSTDLHDQLADLATDAPTRPMPAAELWQRGRRNGRRRRAVRVAAAALCVVLLGLAGSTTWRALSTPDVPPTDTPSGDLHLPQTLFMPSPWTEGTASAGQIGPLSALGARTRLVPDGLFGSHSYFQLFGISAVDGTARFLDIPTTGDPDWPGRSTQVALSPDGRKVGYLRYENANPSDDGTLLGWGVYDTVTGETVELADPRVPHPTGLDAFEIEFSADSRYLETVYSPTEHETSRTDVLAVWDVETGERIHVEGPGYYWLPNMGTGPAGIVWGRDDRVFTFDPATRTTTSVGLNHEVADAAWAPQGTSFAYLAMGKPDAAPERWRLFVGSDVARLTHVRLRFEPNRVLGWRDRFHVVVDDYRLRYAVVDVRTGAASYGRIHHRGNWALAPQLAADLWGNSLVPGVPPPEAHDPRAGWRVGGLVAGGGLLGVGVVLLVLRGRRRHGRSPHGWGQYGRG